LPFRDGSSDTSIFEVLDRAQTPSLMAPFQVIFVRNVRQLYTRGAKKEEFAAVDRTISARPIRRRWWCLSPTTSAFPRTRAAWTAGQGSLRAADARRWASTAAWWNWPAWTKNDAMRWAEADGEGTNASIPTRRASWLTRWART
jgi:hypothetical protein